MPVAHGSPGTGSRFGGEDSEGFPEHWERGGRIRGPELFAFVQEPRGFPQPLLAAGNLYHGTGSGV